MNKLSYFKLVTDLGLLFLCFLMASAISTRALHRVDILIAGVLMAGWYFSSRMTHLYDDFRTERYIGELLLILENVAVQLVLIGQIYFFLNSHNFARRFTVAYIGLVLVLVLIKAYVTKKMLLVYRERGGNFRRVVFIGFNEITQNLLERILDNPQYGLRVVGIVAKESVSFPEVPYLGNLDSFMGQQDVPCDEVIITSDRLDKDALMEIFRFSDHRAIRARVVPNYLDYYQSRFHFQVFGNYPLITLRSEPLQEGFWRWVKRVFDVVFSLVLFIVLFSWLFPIIALLIKLDSPGPVFFRQDRWGKNGEKFLCYKFRSMKVESRDVTDNGEFNQARAGDSRITKLGAFLRKTSLDELPQFINVLLGDMSVVGPRPHAHEHNLRTKDQVSSYMVRHWIRPGVTGWAQVNGYRGETRTVEQMQKRVEFDIWYIENWSFWLDIRIILMTAYNMLKGEENAY
ncbi:MAG: undecaprenyl-phosphate glucose phosphotransferase [Spirosomataceae bacterium]